MKVVVLCIQIYNLHSIIFNCYTRLIKEALRWGTQILAPVADTARLDAELLLAHVLHRPVTFLLAYDETRLSHLQMWRYKQLIARRKEGIPVAYLRGYKEFYGLDFVVNTHVLIPRPDTEILVEKAVEYLKNYELRITNYELSRVLLIDVGTGSGCIAISVLKSVPGLTAVATDLSAKALLVARKNVRLHEVSNRIRFFKSDLLASVPQKYLLDRNLIVTANLPYVPEGYAVTPSVHFEPHMAVYAGKDGLDLYRRFAKQVTCFQPRAIFLELLEEQVESMIKLFPGYGASTIHNLRGQVRFLKLSRLSNK